MNLEDGPSPNDEFDQPPPDEYAICPEHQLTVKITAWGSTGGPDPYATDILECGHEITSFGPGDPYYVVHTHQTRLRRFTEKHAKEEAAAAFSEGHLSHGRKA